MSHEQQVAYPDCLQYAVSNPLFKKGERPLIANYRPVSLLIGFSKIFELLIFHRLKQHLTQHFDP
jgi:hypothetical protein